MEKRLMSGNEAIARGAFEAGVEVVTGYPGTPSTETLEELARIEKMEKAGIHIEWSVNEKVALEVAAGASWAGKRALTTMKMSGLNVASDSLLSIAYSGCNGGLVVYVADDPGAIAGMVQQDSRLYARLGELPCLDVSSPGSARKFCRIGFELSEKTGAPVILRSTTRGAHSLELVEQEERESPPGRPEFKKNLSKFTKASSSVCTAQHLECQKRLKEVLNLGEKDYSLNKLELKGEFGVISCGTAGMIAREIADKNSLNLSFLEVDICNPPPIQKIERMLEHASKVLVVEELTPLIELETRSMAYGTGKKVEILGKLNENGQLSTVGELSYEDIRQTLSVLTGNSLLSPPPISREILDSAREMVPARQLSFCAGCPHRGTFLGINEGIKRAGYKKQEIKVTGDIGCTILGMNPPFNSCWSEVSMGASIGIAEGFRIADRDKPVIATIGDSTFFHAGIPPLINAKQHSTGFVLVILDNGWTAMTGFQPNPGTGKTALGQESERVEIKQVVKGLGIRQVEEINAFDVEEIAKGVSRGLEREGISVIIARGECATQMLRREKPEPFEVNQEKCTGCKRCINVSGCPAIETLVEKARIVEELCTGCGICSWLCPENAITEKKQKEGK
jgi:indolepyruvate ferredoxin oxidoreductase alpha subunit